MTIKIYNSLDVEMYNCPNNFKEICISNNLPFNALKKSYQNKNRVYESQPWQCPDEHKQFMGWCALKEGDELPQHKEHAIPNKLSFEEFKNKANKIHGNKYTYLERDFKPGKSKELMVMYCPIHGKFSKSPNNHLKLTLIQGCQRCSNKFKILNLKEFINLSNLKHNNYYSYNKVLFVNNSSKVIITCPIHGDFDQNAAAHALRGNGCRKCSLKHSQSKRRVTREEFIERSIDIHSTYNYDKVEKFNNSFSKVIITCPIHGDFKQAVYSHLGGRGCPDCGTIRAMNKTSKERYSNKPTTIYYIYLPDYDLYKIGLTQKGIKSRFKVDIDKGIRIEVISAKMFEDGLDAFNLEQLILSTFNDSQYRGDKILCSGNTELFTMDVLQEYTH